MHKTVVIEALVAVLTDLDSPSPHAIYEGLFPNIYIDGRYYPGKVVRCSHTLGLGASGEVQIWMEDSEESPSLLHPGSSFELRGGPKVPIAKCKVISIRPLEALDK